MENKYKLLVSVIVFVLLVNSFYVFAQESANETVIKIITSGVESVIDEETRLTTYTYSKTNSSIKIGDNIYDNILPSEDETIAYIKVDRNNEIIKADITASENASFVFNNKTIDVPKGTRIFYEDGKINIKGQGGDEIGFSDDKIKLGNDRKILIEEDVIKGSNFQVGDLVVEGISDSEFGEVRLVEEGYLLGRGSVGMWKGLILTGEEEVLLAKSEQRIDNHKNWILPEEKRLRAKGSNFEVLFNEENQWANVEDIDWFRVKAGKGFELDMYNRESEGLIPKMILDGEFKVLQDHKEIFMENEKILIKAHKYESWLTDAYLKGEIGKKEFLGVHMQSYTSPVEILVKRDSEFLDKKVIVSNFKGFGIANLDADKVILEESYAKSNLFKEIDNTLAFNYPSYKDFEKISGKQIVFFSGEQEITFTQGPFYKPEIIRTFIDYWESLPEASKESISRIVVSGQKVPNKFLRKGTGAYNPKHNTIHFRWDDKWSESIDDPETEYGTFRHELAHSSHDFINGRESSRKILSSKNINEWAVLNDELEDLEDSIKDISLKSDDEMLKGMLLRKQEIYDKMYKIELANLYSGVAEIKQKVPEYKDLREEDVVLKKSIDKYYKESSEDVLRGMWMEKVGIENKMKANNDKLFGPFAPDSEFTKSWERIIGEDIDGKALIKVTKGRELIRFKWADGAKGNSPQQGFVSSYGATELNEDVATYVQKIVSDPGFFKKNGLINGVDSRYKKKINLLYKNGLITEGEYEAVFE